MFGLRRGTDPRVMVTTTPRPTRLIKDLVADPTVAISRGTTYQNRANLAGAFLEQIVKKYEGTRLGRQELNAELLDDMPGALWNRALIEAARALPPPSSANCRSPRRPRPPRWNVPTCAPMRTRPSVRCGRVSTSSMRLGFRGTPGPIRGHGVVPTTAYGTCLHASGSAAAARAR